MTDNVEWRKVQPRSVNEFHTNDDVDSGTRAHHHTLGEGVNQAARGSDLKALGSIVAELIASVETLTNELDLVNDLVPQIGDLLVSQRSAETVNYKLANGQALATVDYPELFALYGYIYGGAGANFNLPDYSDRSPVGKSGTKALGSTGGSDTHTLTTANLPPHTHDIPRSAATGTDATFARGGVFGANIQSGNGGFANTAVNHVNKYLASNYFVRVK